MLVTSNFSISLNIVHNTLWFVLEIVRTKWTNEVSFNDIVNSLPNDKILDWSRLKAFADDKLNLIEKLKFVLERAENIVGKGENAGYQHFLLFLQFFQKASFTEWLKVGSVR